MGFQPARTECRLEARTTSRSATQFLLFLTYASISAPAWEEGQLPGTCLPAGWPGAGSALDQGRQTGYRSPSATAKRWAPWRKVSGFCPARRPRKCRANESGLGWPWRLCWPCRVAATGVNGIAASSTRPPVCLAAQRRCAVRSRPTVRRRLATRRPPRRSLGQADRRASSGSAITTMPAANSGRWRLGPSPWLSP